MAASFDVGCLWMGGGIRGAFVEGTRVLEKQERAAGGVRKSCRGFTLVEIMIVVAVIAVVFTIGAPSFVRMAEKGPMRQAVSDVVEALGQARAQAILRGATMEFVLNGDGFMQVRPALDQGTEPESEPRRLEEGREGADGLGPSIFSARLNDDIAITQLELNFKDFVQTVQATEVRVRFHANGTSDDFSVVLEYGREMRRIWLDPITAQTELETLR